MKNIFVILSVDEEYGIGKNNSIPWKSDLKYFKTLTETVRDLSKKNALIMGKRTCNSLDIQKLSKTRKCIVLSKSGNTCLEGVDMKDSLNGAIYECMNDTRVENIFVIGGAGVYKDVLYKADFHVKRIYVTRVEGKHDCDIKVEWLCDYLKYRCKLIMKSEAHEEYKLEYSECEYLHLLEAALLGRMRNNRTGTKTLSIFAPTPLRFSLMDQFPLLTTKKVFWRGVLHELLFFLKGCTDARHLESKGVNIWKGNSTREFLDSRRLFDNREGDLGPVYGFQWRHWNAKYCTCEDDYTNKGVDQIQRLIDGIRNDPDSRRHILTAWNPEQLDEMALPPCHMMCQFYVHDGKLSCQMYQRSADLFLGLPFNIASYAALTYVIAHVTNLQPYELIMVLGDAHLYETHVKQTKEQLKNKPFKFPKLCITNPSRHIDDLSFEDFVLNDYHSASAINAKMII
jgi:dihydrofolate reductase/thymidylate synthase